ncbi:MAG TPA: hypothetical protein DCS30_07890 [Rhizobiales bacterium]|nr:hypothetical protein [Hyphomicrobiales bacterium]
MFHLVAIKAKQAFSLIFIKCMANGTINQRKMVILLSAQAQNHAVISSASFLSMLSTFGNLTCAPKLAESVVSF